MSRKAPKKQQFEYLAIHTYKIFVMDRVGHMLRRILLPVFLFVPVYIFSAQTDSLLLKINQSASNSEKIRWLTELCSGQALSQLKEKDKYLEQLETLAKTETNPEVKAEAFSALGKSYEENNLVKANEFYSMALDIYKDMGGKTGEWGYAKTLLKYGTVFHYNGDFGTAIHMYLEVENALQKFKDIKLLATLYIKMGDAYDKLGNADKRNFYNAKAIDYALESKDTQLLGKAYMTKAINLIYTEKYDEAETFCQKAYEIALQTGNKMQQHIVHYNLGVLNTRKELYNQALSHYQKAFALAREINAHNDGCDALYKVGLIQYYMENFPVARKTLLNALAIADSLNSFILKRNIYDVLSCLETEAGNHKKANEYLNSFIDQSGKIFSDESQKQVNFLEAKYQAQKRESEIKRLEDEKKIKDLQLTKNRQWIFILLAIVLLVSVIAVFIHYNYRNKRKIAMQESQLKEQKILELEKDRQLLATKSVLQGEEAERSRLARDLHDGLGGLLSGLKLSLTSIKGNIVLSGSGMNQFDAAIGLLDNSIREMRRVAHNMMPEALVKYGLRDALSDFCNSLDNNIGIKFQSFGSQERINSNIEIQTYRIAQELINNALKHSGASELLVQLVQEENRIHLTVQDNGRGFDIAILNSSKGAGIANIRSRVEAQNGHFEIVPVPDKGTEATVEFKW